MDIFIYVALSLILLIGLVIYIYYKNRKKRELLAKIERENYNILLNTYLNKVKKANSEFKQLALLDKYICNYDTFLFRLKHRKLYDEIPFLQIDALADEGEAKQQSKLFKSNFENINTLIGRANNDFIESELEKHETYFDNIDGNSLDQQQRKAILIDEDNHIVIAGAGTGKTTTIAGKVKYLIDKNKGKPKEILLLAFTRKAAEEMQNRIKEKMNIDISVKTFHKLGLDIISESNNEMPSIFNLSVKETLELFASFVEHAKKDSKYFSNLIQFFIFWLKPYKEETDFKTEGERTNYLIDQKYEGLKLVENTVAGILVKYREKLKSQEEVLIANFLFTNNIEYAYEERYKYKTASKTFGQYKPDFYLPDYDIYIEHFAIDRNRNVPDWFKGDDSQTAKEKYNAGIDWKREEHERNATVLIETYSWEKQEGILLSNLEEKLIQKGVALNPKSNDEIWEYLTENTPEEINDFTTLVHTFLVLFKSSNLSVSKLKSMAQENEDERATLFLDLFIPLLKSYENYIQEKDQIDFNDMINKATNHVKNKDFTSPYKYIIVDEFQDISLSRYQLIKSLLDKKPNTKLFCVGDDWQSIYRFTGSDIGIFTQFEDYFKSSSIKGFERKTSKSYIENTYRFDNQLIELSSKFILKNPNQIPKGLSSNKKSDKKPITVLDYDYNISIINPLHDAFDLIEEDAKTKTVSVKLLGRYFHDIKEIKENSQLDFFYDHNGNISKIIHPKYQNLKIDFHTVHKAKGLEADYIIILNGTSGKYGFPSEISDDPMLNFLLSKSDQFPNGEERRLFYVALTRARKHVYILTNKENRSKFIDEIEIRKKIANKKCEWCDNGVLIERDGPHGYFYACSNSHYCNYTRKMEPSDCIHIIEKANKYQDDKDYDNAIMLYSKAQKIDNTNYLVFYNRGRCYEETGNKVEAYKDYSMSIRLNDNHSSSYYWRASCLYDLKQYKRALSDWTSVIIIDKTYTSVYYWRGLTFMHLKMYKEAIQDFTDAIDFESNESKNYELRGECYILNESEDNRILAWLDFEKAKKLGSNTVNKLFEKYNLIEKPKDTREKVIYGDVTKMRIAIWVAISTKQMIKIYYKKYNSSVTEIRMIKPDRLEYDEVSQSEYVIGYCTLRKAERKFNLKRVSTLVVNPKID